MSWLAAGLSVWAQVAIFSVLAITFGGRLIRRATSEEDTATQRGCYAALFALTLLVDGIWIGRALWRQRQSPHDHDGRE
jgi:hypothetical protein